MSDQRIRARDNTNRDELIFIAVSIVLIGNFLWLAFFPATEYPMRSMQVLTMALDAMMITGLTAMKSRVPKLQTLFWVALLAGIGLFLIRLNGDASWWTGHLMYKIR